MCFTDHRDDLHIECSIEDAEAVADLVFNHIGEDNLISFAKLVNSVSDEIRAAAMAVLQIGSEDIILQRSGWINRETIKTPAPGEAESGTENA